MGTEVAPVVAESVPRTAWPLEDESVTLAVSAFHVEAC
jgi:hypothetical protein